LSYSVEVVSTPEGLLDLRKAWDHLANTAEHPNVFTTFEWVWTWWQHGGGVEAPGKDCRLHVLHLHQGGKTTGIIPLMRRTASRAGLSVRKLEFIGLGLNDYNDFLLEGDAAAQIASALDYLWSTRENWDLIELSDLGPESGTPTVLRQALADSRFHCKVRSDHRCVYVPIDTDWSGFLKRHSKRFRHNLTSQANRLKRLEAEGLRVRILENPEQEPGLLQRMTALESSKRVRRASLFAILHTAPGFFQRLLETLGPAGWLYLALMEKHNHLIAYELGFRHGGKLLAYNKAFDAAYAYYSPGTMLIPAVFDYGFKHGYREYDFMRGDEPYKARWSQHAHQNSRFALWTPGWRSDLMACLYLSVRPRIPQRVWGGMHAPRG